MNFYLIVLSSITIVVIQLINRSINKFYNFVNFGLQNNAVLLLLNYFVLILCLFIPFVKVLFLLYFFTT